MGQPDGSGGGPLVELARNLVYFRGEVLVDHERTGWKVRFILWSSITLVLAGLVLAIVDAFGSVTKGSHFGMVIGAVLLMVTGTIGVQRSASQATYELVSRAMEVTARIVGVFIGVLSVGISASALAMLTLEAPGVSPTSSGLVSFALAMVATLTSWAVADSSRSVVRADKGRSRQWDSGVRLILMWLTLLAVIWIAIQVAARIQAEVEIVGLIEIVVILAAPLIFAYVNHRRDVRERLARLAAILGETEAAAEAVIRKNASAEARALLRAQLVKLQTHLHTDRVAKLAGFRIRGLVDGELVILIDRVCLQMVKVSLPPGSETNTKRVRWLDSQLPQAANPSNLAALVRELRRRTLAAIRHY